MLASLASLAELHRDKDDEDMKSVVLRTPYHLPSRSLTKAVHALETSVARPRGSIAFSLRASYTSCLETCLKPTRNMFYRSCEFDLMTGPAVYYTGIPRIHRCSIIGCTAYLSGVVATVNHDTTSYPRNVDQRLSPWQRRYSAHSWHRSSRRQSVNPKPPVTKRLLALIASK
jgi:hypothetical protein